jgi:hypothetical protein
MFSLPQQNSVQPKMPTVYNLLRRSDDAMPVIDPEIKHHVRVWIQYACIAHTSGVDRYKARYPYPPSLCMLYQLEKCHAGSKCNQIHADRKFIGVARHLLRDNA